MGDAQKEKASKSWLILLFGDSKVRSKVPLTLHIKQVSYTD